MTLTPRSSLVLLIPEVDPVVGSLRREHDPAARAGLGAHITMLFPFVPAARIDRTLLGQLETQLARAPGISGALELRFDRVGRFPGLSYLALADPEVVAVKIRALAAAWPDYPLYEGRFPDVIPHLTVAHGDEAVHATVERELTPVLPLVVRVRVASLVVEDDAGRWHIHTQLALQ